MKTLYYLSYNNYYNRILKREETIEDYLAKAELCGAVVEANFAPNDGVSTTHTAYLNALNNIPNYLVVAEDTGEIVSRWFVIDCQYEAGKIKYDLSFYRDLIAEWWPQIMEQPFFCEKGSLSVLDNGIFNDEAITTSQIKKEEHQLKDGSGIPWIVGYYASPLERDTGGALKDTDKTYVYSTTKITPDITVEDINNWEYKNGTLKMVDDWNVSIYYYQTPLLGSNAAWFVPYRPGQPGTPYKADVTYGNWKTTANPKTIVNDLSIVSSQGDRPTLLKNVFAAHTGYSFDESLRRTWLNLDGKKILDEATGTLYEIAINRRQINEENEPVSIGTQLGQMINDQAELAATDGGYIWTGQPNANNQRYSCTHSEYTVRLVAVTTDEGSFTIKKTRRQLYDAPYCMFCIPYGDHPIRVNAQITTASSATESLNIASALATQSGGWLYDIQLLPYCPIPELRYSAVEDLPLIGPEMVADQDYTMVYGSSNNITGIIYWAQFSKGSFTIESPTSFTLPDNPFIFKSKCQTEFMRLCSPNYNGVFEFSPYKNRGLDYFVVDYTYKPFQPYIRVAPNFGGLYGQEFSDARGLILGGDFSLAQLNDAWRSYELENKNYQGMFNRQIENMEVQHKYQRIQDIANTITGTVGGSATGSMAGGMTGGAYGAIAGGILGGASSLAGGIADWRINQALRGEALDYTKDLFGYQLDNIKALPYALTRVSAFNINNKLFPFLEIYGTTQEEYNAVYNKIKYNGMTVERIGTISAFSLPIDDGDDNLIYVKGQLIRFPEAIAEDFHTVNTLGIELNKGVYVK